jgi:hypothetical protein
VLCAYSVCWRHNLLEGFEISIVAVFLLRSAICSPGRLSAPGQIHEITDLKLRERRYYHGSPPQDIEIADFGAEFISIYPPLVRQVCLISI